MNVQKCTGTSYYLLEFLSYLVNHHFPYFRMGLLLVFYILFEMVDMVDMVLDAADEKQLLAAMSFSVSTSDIV